MYKLRERSFQLLLLFALVLGGLSTWVYNNNDYLTYRDVNVTFIDRHGSNSCHKGTCRDYLIGLFKTDDGLFFERPIGLYMYRQMHLGERFTLNLRPMETKQTTYNNIVWMFGPIILYALTFVTICSIPFEFFSKSKS